MVYHNNMFGINEYGSFLPESNGSTKTVTQCHNSKKRHRDNNINKKITKLARTDNPPNKSPPTNPPNKNPATNPPNKTPATNPPNKTPASNPPKNNNKRSRDTNNDQNNKRPKNTNQPSDPLSSFLLIMQNLADEDDLLEPPAVPAPPPYICPGKFCDHDPESKNVPVIPDRLVTRKADYKISLKDLIDLGACFHCKLQQKFKENSLERLAKLHEPLQKLYDMVGMQIIKKSFAEQIVYFLVDLEPNPTELLHTILEGGPGVGKTHVIDILAEIYLNMGFLTKKVIKKVKINDLKGKYIGHTGPMTQKAIDDAMGGVLVIDEAYSLGSSERLDSFSKEIIDTLNRNLTENAGKFICIIAGYGEQIDKCLLAHNDGLKSRFRFRFTIDSYTSDELNDIFNLKLFKDKWGIHDNFKAAEQKKFFKENYASFKYFGRDMETLLFHTKLAHANRVFFEPKEARGKINLTDIKGGYQRFELHNKIKKTDKMPMSVEHMYL